MRIGPRLFVGLLCTASWGFAQTPPAAAPPDEGLLGELVVTGTQQERLPKIAVLPSLAPDLEDVIVRGVVRRDLELTGFFDVIADSKAPGGMYGFEDPVDVAAWQKLGAEAIVKVAARKHESGKIQVFGIAYFLNVGKDPVYEKTLLIDAPALRVTAHRVTDALLGALTGRPGGFASEFIFSGRWGKNRRIFRMDSDGNALTPLTDPADTSIAPFFGKNNQIYFSSSKNYSPFALFTWLGNKAEPVKLGFDTSIYSGAFNKDFSKLALAVSENAQSIIYLGNADGSGFSKISTNELATRPRFSPSGKLAWVGGEGKQGTNRVWLDGKAVSPAGFTASSPAFCETEDGVRVVYSVAVGGDREDLVMTDEKGHGTVRLTQGQGSNAFPACSPDGRLLAFFSTRGKQPGIYIMSLKSFRTQQISTQQGESMVWAALPNSK